MMAPNRSPQNDNPPGVINSVAAGFELTTSHLWFALVPVVLDLFLWLGPRLSVTRLMPRLLEVFPPDEAIAVYTDQLLALAPRVNLLSALSFPLIGVPALMAGPSAEQTPLPTAAVELTSISSWFWLAVVLNLAGLLLGVVYFTMLTQPLRQEAFDLRRLAGRVARGALRLVGLVVIFLTLLVMLGLALLPVLLIVAFFGLGVTAVAFLGGVLGMWLVFYFSFSMHGIVLHEVGVLPAMLGSVRLIQRHMWPALLMLAAVIVVGNGLNTLWRLVDNGSWLTLVSIAGHGFISTGLLVATFLFYQSRTERDASYQIRIV